MLWTAEKLSDKRQPLPAYHLYGLCLRSQWLLPFPESAGLEPTDVELVEGPLSLFSEAAREANISPDAPGWFYYARLWNGSLYLRWSRLFEFLISADGRRVVGRPHTDASHEAFHTYLLGHVLSCALLKRGIESLHVTAVVIDGEAVGFMGDCGYGKSSLGAAFIQAGYSLLSDDLLVVEEKGRDFFAYPGPPRIKLFPEIANSLLGEGVKGTPMHNLTPKLIIPLERQQSYRCAVPLKTIYMLTRPAARRRGEEVSIRGVSQRKSYLGLLKNTFNTVIAEPDRLKRQFALTAQVASKVPIKLLAYPRTLAVLPLVREAILRDLAR